MQINTVPGRPAKKVQNGTVHRTIARLLWCAVGRGWRHALLRARSMVRSDCGLLRHRERLHCSTEGCRTGGKTEPSKSALVLISSLKEAQIITSGRIGHDRLFPRGAAARRRAIGTGPPMQGRGISAPSRCNIRLVQGFVVYGITYSNKYLETRNSDKS